MPRLQHIYNNTMYKTDNVMPILNSDILNIQMISRNQIQIAAPLCVEKSQDLSLSDQYTMKMIKKSQRNAILKKQFHHCFN